MKDPNAPEVLRINHPFQDGLWGINADFRRSKLDQIKHLASAPDTDVELWIARCGVSTHNDSKGFQKSVRELLESFKILALTLEREYEQEMGDLDDVYEKLINGPELAFTKDTIFGVERDRFFLYEGIKYLKLQSGLLYKIGENNDAPDLVIKSSMADLYGVKNKHHFPVSTERPPVFQTLFDYITVTKRILMLKKETHRVHINDDKIEESSRADTKGWFATQYHWILENKVIERRSELYSIILQDDRTRKKCSDEQSPVICVERGCDNVSEHDEAACGSLTVLKEATLVAKTRVDTNLASVGFRSSIRFGTISPEMVDMTGKIGKIDKSTQTDEFVAIVKIDLIVKDEGSTSAQYMQETLRTMQVMQGDMIDIAKHSDQKFADIQCFMSMLRPTAMMNLQNQLREVSVVSPERLRRLEELMVSEYREQLQSQLREVNVASEARMRRIEELMISHHTEQQQELHKIARMTNDVIDSCKHILKKIWDKVCLFAENFASEATR